MAHRTTRTAVHCHAARQHGFSLLELMVGMVIGLFSLLAIYQLFAFTEGRQRSAVSLSEGQTSGSMALYTVERDILSAGTGFGMVSASHLGCDVLAHHSNRSPADFSFRLLPVLIRPGGNGESDEVWVLSGNSANLPAGARYVASTTAAMTMDVTNAGIHAGDVLVGTSESLADQCLMLEATQGQGGGDERRVMRQNDTYRHFYSGDNVAASRNAGAHAGLLNKSGNNLGEGVIYNLGPAPTLNVWRVDDNGSLGRYNHLETDTEGFSAVVQDIIQFKAEYGYDGNGDGRLEDAEWTVSPPDSPVRWERVLAVRMAVLLRVSQYEKREVTSQEPRWSQGRKAFVMTKAGNDWKHYRYRVYESTMSLRNAIWGRQA